MLLSDVVLLAFGAALVLALQMRVFVGHVLPGPARSEWVSVRVSVVLVFTFLALMAVRNPDFGVDTAAYTELFIDHCRGGHLTDAETSFLLSAQLLRLGMLGSCDVGALRATWAGLIIAGLLCMAWPVRGQRWRYAALLLFSMVGIELATNALRQGFSVALTMIAVSQWPRHRLIALGCALAAVALHVSAGLIFMALAIAWLPWRSYAVVMVVCVLGVLQLIANGIEPALLRAFLFEIQKYLGHEDDELYIRALAVAGVLAVLASAWWAADGRPMARAVRAHPAYGRALRLALTALPFLVLPYFGYRYVYGVHPIVLFLTMQAAQHAGVRPGRHMLWLLALQMVVLLAWLLGSAVMMETPFLG